MASSSSFEKSLQEIRTLIAAAGGKRGNDLGAYRAIISLFRDPDRILKDADRLEALLALAPEIEAYRGKGSQILQREFSRALGALLFYGEGATGTSSGWAEKLSDHFFARVQGPPGRSRHGGGIRAEAWSALGELDFYHRRPELLSLALETAADKRRPDAERLGAVEFLTVHWAEEDPDKATVDLLDTLVENPPNRSFLVTVLQARIDLGLSDEMEALFEVEDWDDEEDEGEEE